MYYRVYDHVRHAKIDEIIFSFGIFAVQWRARSIQTAFLVSIFGRQTYFRGLIGLFRAILFSILESREKRR